MSRLLSPRNSVRALVRGLSTPSSSYVPSIASQDLLVSRRRVAVSPPPSAAATIIRELSSRSRRGTGSRRAPPRPAAVPVPVDQAWVEVKDDASGMTYWWNQQTNETTHLGAPKPIGATALAVPPPQGLAVQQPGQPQSLGSIMKEGLAFGAGSAIAHRAIGSLFGGGSSSSHSSSHFDDSGDDDFTDV